MEQIKEKATKQDPGSINSKNEINTPLWLSVSEAAKFGGVQTKTIRRALKIEEKENGEKTSDLKFKIIKNRYQIELDSLLIYINSKKKLQNKFLENGLGQYLKRFKEVKEIKK